MNNRDWESMNENEFDSMLENSISEVPPEEIVAQVTPWKKAMNRVLMGIALCSLTLNFGCLSYLLPTVGMILSLLGFRSLRQENIWFKICLIITMLRAAFFFPELILNTTIIQEAFFSSTIAEVVAIVNPFLLFIQYFCLWRGLRTVQQKVNLSPRAKAVVALMIWFVCMCILVFVRYNGLVIGIAMILGFFIIIYSIHKLSKELDEAGYSIHPATVKVTDKAIVLMLILLLALGCFCGYYFGGSYPMNWTPIEESEKTEAGEIQAQLMELGFPEYVLQDLSAEDIAACEGAMQIVEDIYKEKELRITNVGVQLSGERDKWIIFHHFLWTSNPGFYGTESIQIWPVYKNISEGWISDGGVSGRVLYDKNGKTFVAPYHSIGEQTYTYSDILWGDQTNTDIFATFSMPEKGIDCRGYVAYPIKEIQDGYIISSWINYTHQESWLQYPVMTAMENRMRNSWNNDGAFMTIQNVFTLYPTDEGVEIIK